LTVPWCCLADCYHHSTASQSCQLYRMLCAPGVAMMVVFTTAYSLIFAWLRFRSGSVWPSTLAHAALNAQAGFLLLALSQGNSLLRPPLGVIGIVPALALGIWLAATGKLRPMTLAQ
jgi:membrane protease YdiL (CAAX protease family)